MLTILHPTAEGQFSLKFTQLYQQLTLRYSMFCVVVGPVPAQTRKGCKCRTEEEDVAVGLLYLLNATKMKTHERVFP